MRKILTIVCLLGGLLLTGAEPVFRSGKPVIFNGKDTSLKADESIKLNFEQGATFSIVARIDAAPGQAGMYGMFFFRDNEVLFGYTETDKLYFNYHNGQGWNAALKTNKIPAVRDGNYHHFVCTIKRQLDPTKGEDSMETAIYLDGVQVAEQRFYSGAPNQSPASLEIGSATASRTFGEWWQFEGEMYAAAIYDRVLSGAEIRQDVLRFTQVKPLFNTPAKLEESDRLLLEKHSRNFGPAAGSALMNTALTKSRFDWRKASAKDLHILKGNQSQLVLVSGGIAGWYDTVAERELLNWDNPWFSLSSRIENKIYHSGGFDPSVRSRLVSPPVSDADGACRFRIEFTRAADSNSPLEFTVQANFKYYRDRLEFDLEVIRATGQLSGVDFPAVRLKKLDAGTDFLIAPLHLGVAYPDAAAKGRVYVGRGYPQAKTTIQFGAYHDDVGGVYFASEDPLARPKDLNFTAGEDGFEAVFRWIPDTANFKPDCNAALELFRGNWFDTAAIYQQTLTRIKAPWWKPERRKKPTAPEWFLNNTVWVQGLWNHNDKDWNDKYLKQLKQWREYLELPFAVHWYHWQGKHDTDYPHHRPDPEFMERMRDLHDLGIRVAPYTNGRLWETLDRRNEDYQFSSLGMPNSIIDNTGRIVYETYNRTKFSVICPATKVYSDKISSELDFLAALGVDGIYVDQIGDGWPHLCYSTAHGHKPGELVAWTSQGHYPAFDRIKQARPELILTTESNAEPCLRNFDGVLCRIAMFEHQVPLYPAIYSGTVQFVGQGYTWRNNDPLATLTKTATQFLNGEQLGWFHTDYMCFPDFHDMRVMVKQFAHLRLALLDFFNKGQMARPVDFKVKQELTRMCWGMFGDRYVSTPPVLSSHWQWGKLHMIALSNTRHEVQRNTLLLPKEITGYDLYIPDTGGKVERSGSAAGELAFELPPRMPVIIVAAPRGMDISALTKRLDEAAAIVRRASADHDPFTVAKEAK